MRASLRWTLRVGVAESCSCTGTFCSAREIPCDGPEDCPAGDVCCLRDSPTSFVIDCQASCESGITTDRDELCHVDDGVECLVSGHVCGADDRLPDGLNTCNAP